jgi:DNA-binding transcriptional ArsR family regulator
MAAVLQALAEPTRLAVVQLLSTGPRRAGELARAAHTSAPSMSKHLRVLLETGIVTDERRSEDARLRVFRLRPEPFVALRAWLDQLQAVRGDGPILHQKEWPWLPAYVVEDPEGHRWTFAQARPTQRP